jgi:hypothetical protein
LISCQTFRATVRPGSEDAIVLEHLRSCDACLDYALSIDPDFFFRTLGGAEIVPPGGIDNFVSDVMAQVRLRQAEGSAAHRLPLNRYLRAAAAVVFVIAGATGVYRYSHPDASRTPVLTAAAAPAVQARETKAVVETYDSQNATIVEMPRASTSDAKVVMIYDESLPADL